MWDGECRGKVIQEEASARGVSVHGRAEGARPAEWAEGEHFDGRVGTSATTVLGGSGADMGEKVTCAARRVGRRRALRWKGGDECDDCSGRIRC